MDEFFIPQFKYDEPHLRYNANICLYGLTIILHDKNISLSFKTFLEIKNLIADFFYPLKIHLMNKFKLHIAIPSLGKVLWYKFKYLLYWKLGTMKIIQTQQYYKKLTFCKLILLGRHILAQG